MEQARAAAFADAKAKAQQYAAAAGQSLGKPTQVTETVSSPSTPIQSFAAAAPNASTAVPIKAGSAEISVNVTVVFAVG